MRQISRRITLAVATAALTLGVIAPATNGASPIKDVAAAPSSDVAVAAGNADGQIDLSDFGALAVVPVLGGRCHVDRGGPYYQSSGGRWVNALVFMAGCGPDVRYPYCRLEAWLRWWDETTMNWRKLNDSVDIQTGNCNDKPTATVIPGHQCSNYALTYYSMKYEVSAWWANPKGFSTATYTPSARIYATCGPG